jgi:hypothetical protein
MVTNAVIYIGSELQPQLTSLLFLIIPKIVYIWAGTNLNSTAELMRKEHSASSLGSARTVRVRIPEPEPIFIEPIRKFGNPPEIKDLN